MSTILQWVGLKKPIHCKIIDSGLFLADTIYAYFDLWYIIFDFLETTEEQTEDTELVEEPLNKYESPQQLSSPLITLSLLPESRWKTLINLELIKVK